MTLGEKLRHLRHVEGTARGLGRPLSQSEVVRELRAQSGQTISQAYLSQVENGKRRQLTDETRMLLARFFHVHPGQLVSDPEGYAAELPSPVCAEENRLDTWLAGGAERFAADRELREVLLALAAEEDTRGALLLLGRILARDGLRQQLTASLESP